MCRRNTIKWEGIGKQQTSETKQLQARKWSIEWEVSNPKAAEAAIVLNILWFAKELTSTNLEGELLIINDNKLLHEEINEKLEKAGQHANDAGGMVTKKNS